MHYLPNAERFKRMTTDEIRGAFLLQGLFREGEIVLRYPDLDRVIVGGVVPSRDQLSLEAPPELAEDYFAARREIGLLNIGGPGSVSVDGEGFEMAPLDMLYVGRGAKAIRFESSDPSQPARFYLVSYPAHAAYPTRHVSRDEADATEIGTDAGASRRILRKYIHPAQVESSQLVMGITEVQPGSVWNTMPAHTHARRTEVYMYFGVPQDQGVFHLMGEPAELRTIVVRDGEAVLSPGWSIHAGAGTSAYTFCWAMGGENQDFGDMQHVDMSALR